MKNLIIHIPLEHLIKAIITLFLPARLHPMATQWSLVNLIHTPRRLVTDTIHMTRIHKRHTHTLIHKVIHALDQCPLCNLDQ